MDLPDPKQLSEIIDLCRKKGIDVFELPGKLRLELGAEPVKKSRRSKENEAGEDVVDPTNPYANFPTGTLTPEQLMFYSSGGVPENDPALKSKGEDA